MPCVEIKLSSSLQKEQKEAVKKELGKAICCLPGKSEDWLMVTLQDDCAIWFRGETGRPMAMVEVKIFGSKVDKEGSQAMTAQVCRLLQEHAGVSPEDVYIRYTASENWGWNGQNF